MSLEDQSRTATRLTRKRLSSILDAMKMTPLRSRNPYFEDGVEQYTGTAAAIHEVASVTMTISPPKKMKLPALSATEKMSQNKSITTFYAKCNLLIPNFV
jgi:hypothetical protein